MHKFDKLPTFSRYMQRMENLIFSSDMSLIYSKKLRLLPEYVFHKFMFLFVWYSTGNDSWNKNEFRYHDIRIYLLCWILDEFLNWTYFQIVFMIYTICFSLEKKNWQLKELILLLMFLSTHILFTCFYLWIKFCLHIDLMTN